MAFAGKWTKTAVEGGDAFFTACGISAEMKAAAESLVSMDVEEAGDAFTFKKVNGSCN